MTDTMNFEFDEKTKQQISPAIAAKIDRVLNTKADDSLLQYIFLLAGSGRTFADFTDEIVSLFEEEPGKKFSQWIFKFLSDLNDPSKRSPSKRSRLFASALEDTKKGSRKGKGPRVVKRRRVVHDSTTQKMRISAEEEEDREPAKKPVKSSSSRRVLVVKRPSSSPPDAVVLTQSEPQTVVMRKASLKETEAPSESKAVRCKYWPTCQNGDACPFVHPTEKCTFWPNCTFGDACLKIHPQYPCKFGGNCTNPTCAYVHPAWRQLGRGRGRGRGPQRGRGRGRGGGRGIGRGATIPCKFGPKCTRADCKFSHPGKLGNSSSLSSEDKSKIPCRYDPSCNVIACLYSHPKREERDKEFLGDDVKKLSDSLPQTPPRLDTA